MHLAALGGNLAALHVLLRAGAEVDAEDEARKTAGLDRAPGYWINIVVIIFLSQDGRTALWIARYVKKDAACVDALLAVGARESRSLIFPLAKRKDAKPTCCDSPDDSSESTACSLQ